MTKRDVPVRVFSQIGPWGMVPVWILNPDMYLPGVPDPAALKPGDERPINGSELRVYVSLRSFSDKSGESHPYVKTIAERAGVDKSTAERALSKFKRLGWLATKRVYRYDGSIAHCDYYLADVCPAPVVPAAGEPEGVPVDSRVPHPSNHGYPPRESTGAKNTPGEHTKRTQVLSCPQQLTSFAAGRDTEDDQHGGDEPPPHLVEQQKRDDTKREQDRALFRGYVGDRIKSAGMKTWNLGTFTADAIYQALRTRSGRRKAIDWPGAYLAGIDAQAGEAGFERWLDEQGFTLLLDETPARA